MSDPVKTTAVVSEHPCDKAFSETTAVVFTGSLITLILLFLLFCRISIRQARIDGFPPLCRLSVLSLFQARNNSDVYKRQS